MRRCPLNKTAMISLIKAGAFDTLAKVAAAELNIEPRVLVMIQYLMVASEPKSKLNLQNVNGLIEKGLFPPELDLQKKAYKFNKFCKKAKAQDFYQISEIMMEFLEKYYPNLVDSVQVFYDKYYLKQDAWDRVYKKEMDKVRTWLQEHQTETLNKYNEILFLELWDKYAKGSVSAWEMEALCFYYHEHELAHINKNKYGIIDFDSLSPVSDIDYFFKRNGKQIPIYKLYRIAGTVISKNDTRHSISLLTTNGVVNVKFTKDFYALYGRQISEPQADGTKKIKEKGWFVRGTKLMITGFRRDDTFVAKRYANTPGHTLYKITDIVGPDIIITSKRYGQDE
jgi:DNA polymerase-3 subunit alpha